VDEFDDMISADEIVAAQKAELVKQTEDGVTVLLATLTCPCGCERAITLMYQCLYCGVWFCEWCAEQHFGKTRKEYHEKSK